MTMIKRIFAAIFLLFLISGNLSYAQLKGAATKSYSGYLHKENRSHRSFLDAIFGGARQEDVDKSMICSLEFQCPTSLPAQPVVKVPEQLTYFIRFSTLATNAPDGSLPLAKDAFKKFTIKIYANDGEEYALDPEAQGETAGPAGGHHIYDPYLIYLVLSQGINHFEILNASGDAKDKYVLDKL